MRLLLTIFILSCLCANAQTQVWLGRGVGPGFVVTSSASAPPASLGTNLWISQTQSNAIVSGSPPFNTVGQKFTNDTGSNIVIVKASFDLYGDSATVYWKFSSGVNGSGTLYGQSSALLISGWQGWVDWGCTNIPIPASTAFFATASFTAVSASLSRTADGSAYDGTTYCATQRSALATTNDLKFRIYLLSN